MYQHVGNAAELFIKQRNMILGSEISAASVNRLVLSGVVAVCAFVVFHLVIHPSLLSPLAKIPSAHWSSSYVSWWIIWKRYQEQELACVKEAHRRSGPIIRLGPTDVSISSYEDGIRMVYGGGFEKPAYFDFSSHYGSDSFCVTHSVRND